MIRPLVRQMRARVHRPAALALVGSAGFPSQTTCGLLPPALAAYTAFPQSFSALNRRHFSSFQDLGISEKLVAALDEMEIPSPTGIQEKSIKAILARKGNTVVTISWG